MEVRKLDLSLVYPSPMNPRKTFDEEGLRELADNIRQQGLLQPITVRPIKHPSNEYGDRPDKYEIVCGERRYRAYRILADQTAGGGNPWGEIMTIVKEMTDEEAFDAMITENLQRKDVDPMEEAFAFGQLNKKGSSVQDIALRFGKSVRFVQDRIKLNSLIPELMKAVKEDKMPISAAMIICKVTDEQQRMYYKQYNDSYQGFTTASASGFVKGLFLYLDNAAWMEYEDEDFAGGCGTSCGECQFNTCNHGCLFYEMKAQRGQCTNEDRYIAKTVAYIENYLRRNDAMLVKAGKPLEKGKTILALDDNPNAPASIRKLKAAVRNKVSSLGYEIVDPVTHFDGICWYDDDDERTQAFLASGKCYRVIQLARHNYISIEPQTWYVKTDDKDTNVDSDGRPIEVQHLVNAYERERIGLPDILTAQGCKTLGAHGRIKELNGLDATESVLAYSMMVKNNRELCVDLGLGEYPKSEEITEYMANHLDMAPFILRAWLKHALSYGTTILALDEVRKMAEPHINRLGKLWCPEKYQETIDKVNAKVAKNQKKIANKLRGLGYTPEGERIDGADNMEAQFKMMKEKHPDALLLFRVNDFYEAIHEDAEKAADVLDITLTTRGKTKLAGFPHHALDSYLPKLTKAGIRVAICETLSKN